MRMTMRTAALLTLAILVAPGCGAKVDETAKADKAIRAISITVAELTRRPVARTVDAIGTLRGWEEVTIGAKRGGRVIKVLKQMGDTVKPGEPLVELATRDADLALDQAEKKLLADLAKLGLDAMPGAGVFDPQAVPAVIQTRVALERAERTLARERSLISRGAGTAVELQNAQNDVDGARAALENAAITARSTLAAARASASALEQAKQAKLDLVVTAPVPSQAPEGEDAQSVVYAVAKRPVHEGQMVKENDPLFELVIQRPLRLSINVPEKYTPEVKLGQEVRLTVAARPGETFTGRVDHMSPSADPVSHTRMVEALVPNHQGLLLPGEFAKVSIVTRPEAEAVVVPIECIVNFAGVTKIFVVEDGKSRAIPVETGLEGKDWVEVTGLLPTRGQVVTSGQAMLAEGTPVSIRKEPKSPADTKP